MKRVIGFVSAFAIASCAASAATTEKTATLNVKKASAAQKLSSSRNSASMMLFRSLAPADEYFGPLKQSILGIKNTIRDLGLRYDVNHDIAPQTIASAALTEGAIKDWEHKYPRDVGIPRAVLQLQRLYAKIATDPGRVKAQATAKWMFGSYSRSPQARDLRQAMASDRTAAAPAPRNDDMVAPGGPPAGFATPAAASQYATPPPSH